MLKQPIAENPTPHSTCLFSELLEATDALIHVMHDELQALSHCDTQAALNLLDIKTQAITRHEQCVRAFMSANTQDILTPEEICSLQDQSLCLKNFLLISEQKLIAFQRADQKIIESVVSHVRKTEAPVCNYTKTGTPHTNETPISAALCNRSL